MPLTVANNMGKLTIVWKSKEGWHMQQFSPEHLAARRKRLGKTQRRLSQEVGISVVSISALEKGRKQPRSTTLAKLAHALECSVDAFFV